MTISMLSISFLFAIVGIFALGMAAWAWFSPLPNDDASEAAEAALETQHQQVLASRPHLQAYHSARRARTLQEPATPAEMVAVYEDLRQQFSTH